MIYAPFVFRIGQLWIQVHPPNPTTKLRMISVGDANHVWALDTSDRLYMRQETSSPAFPEVKLLPYGNSISVIFIQKCYQNHHCFISRIFVTGFVNVILGFKLVKRSNSFLDRSISCRSTQHSTHQINICTRKGIVVHF